MVYIRTTQCHGFSDESRAWVDQKLELWRQTVKANGLRFCRSKIKYMKCDFNATMPEGDVRLNGHMVPKKDTFASWDQCSRRMEKSMKMLVIELRLAG
jgi:hypothetical protein